MEGVDSHNGWPYYSPSSHLSAFAPPFTVNESNYNNASAPFVDSAESAVAITPNHSPVWFDFLSKLDSPKLYGFPYEGLRVVDPPSTQLLQFGPLGLSSEEVMKLGVHEAPQPYYAQKVLSQIYADNSSAPSDISSPPSLWTFKEFYQGKIKEVEDSGLVPKGTFVNQVDGDRDNNNFSNLKKAYPLLISQSSGCSDVGQVSVNQDSEPTSSNNEMSSSWNVTKDVVDFVFRTNGSDQFNRVDSPCWKQAPAARFPLSEVSEALHREFMNMKISDGCYGSDLQGPQNFSLDTYNSSVKSWLSSVKQMEENNFMSQNRCTDSGYHENECLKCRSQAAEHALFSPSCLVNGPTKLKKSDEKVSTPKIIQDLVKTMHNMSELLLDCMSDACEMNEQYRNVLENVISNLRTCAKCAGESPKAQQNASFERPHLTKVGSEHAKVEPENLPVDYIENHHNVIGKEHRKLSDSSHTRGDDIELKNADKMTKAIKSVLSENFCDEEELGSQALLYKNLWLGAEAELSSIKHRARCNQKMIEMEKYSCKQRDNALDKVDQSKLDLDLKLSLAQSSATEVNNFTLTKFSPEGSVIQNVDSFIPDSSSVFHKNEDAGDYEASDMVSTVKFHVNMSCIDTTNPEGLPSWMISQPVVLTPKLASEETDYHQKTQNEVNFSQDSPISAKEPACDDEASMVSEGFGDNVLADHSDDLLSDWEHVEEEEFAGYTLKT